MLDVLAVSFVLVALLLGLITERPARISLYAIIRANFVIVTLVIISLGYWLPGDSIVPQLDHASAGESRKTAIIPSPNHISTGKSLSPSLSNKSSVYAEKYSAVHLTQEVEEVFEQMTPSERVGQLFLVTFEGNSISPEVQELVQEYKVGGLILSTYNYNFQNHADEPATTQVARLSNELQTFAWETTQSESKPFVPLFLAVDHEGNGPLGTAIRDGTTTLPSQLAIGATWSEENARRVGEIVGKELSAIGVNVLFSPVIDVVDAPAANYEGNMGLRVFGGNAHWVGQLGRSYIRGVHQGSENKLITVAKHFPGHGDSNRVPDEEVAVVNHTLQDLKQSDLVPFIRVTSANYGEDKLGVTDAIMSSHIDYQDNIEGPISLTTDGSIGSVTKILQDPAFEQWRDNGGVVIVDSLGVNAVKRWYSGSSQSFPYRRIAMDAFLAGNDVLTLANYSLSGNLSTSFENTKDTIAFFQAEYRQDQSFRTKVDNSVRRILSLKAKIYPELSVEQTLVNIEQVRLHTGKGKQTVRSIAQEAITLLSPNNREAFNRIPIPKSDERILIAVHNWYPRECAICPKFPALPVEALESHIIELKQFDPDHVNSVSFFCFEGEPGLIDFLYERIGIEPECLLSSNEAQRIQTLVDNADWIVLGMLGMDWGPGSIYDSSLSRYDQANTLKTFLDWYAGDANVVAVAFDVPPHNLDSTDISKLTAYYGAYSKVEPFPELIVRAIFKEFTPHNAAPLDIAGTGYDLERQLQPDPQKAFGIQPDNSAAEEFTILEPIHLKTDMIRDHNNNPVPDGTQVTWRGNYTNQDIAVIPSGGSTPTDNGVASASFRLHSSGEIVFQAIAGEARSELLHIQVTSPSPIPATSTPDSAIQMPTVTSGPSLGTAAQTVTATSTTGVVAGLMPTEAPQSNRSESEDQREPDGAVYSRLLMPGIAIGLIMAVLGVAILLIRMIKTRDSGTQADITTKSASGGTSPQTKKQSVKSSDIFNRYRSGVDRLLQEMGRENPAYEDVLILQQRLLENLNQTERQGDNETLRGDRTNIISQLNRICLDVLDRSFNELSDID